MNPLINAKPTENLKEGGLLNHLEKEIRKMSGLCGVWLDQSKESAETPRYSGPFIYSIAKRASDFDEIFRQRYEVYCMEKGWLDAAAYPNKRERDEYDENSVFIVAQNILGAIVGSVRLILPSAKPLPIFKNFDVDVPLEKGKYTEISRLVCMKEARCPGLILGLYQTIFQYGIGAGFTHLFFILELPLLRALRHSKYPIFEIGKAKEYFGAKTMPVVYKVGSGTPYLSCKFYSA